MNSTLIITNRASIIKTILIIGLLIYNIDMKRQQAALDLLWIKI